MLCDMYMKMRQRDSLTAFRGVSGRCNCQGEESGAPNNMRARQDMHSGWRHDSRGIVGNVHKGFSAARDMRPAGNRDRAYLTRGPDASTKDLHLRGEMRSFSTWMRFHRTPTVQKLGVKLVDHNTL